MKYDHARRLLLKEVTSAQNRLDDSIKGGDRDYDKQKVLLAEYQEMLSAADILAREKWNDELLPVAIKLIRKIEQLREPEIEETFEFKTLKRAIGDYVP